jgi:hypothetical protein
LAAQQQGCRRSGGWLTDGGRGWRGDVRHILEIDGGWGGRREVVRRSRSKKVEGGGRHRGRRREEEDGQAIYVMLQASGGFVWRFFLTLIGI